MCNIQTCWLKDVKTVEEKYSNEPEALNEFTLFHLLNWNRFIFSPSWRQQSRAFQHFLPIKQRSVSFTFQTRLFPKHRTSHQCFISWPLTSDVKGQEMKPLSAFPRQIPHSREQKAIRWRTWEQKCFISRMFLQKTQTELSRINPEISELQKKQIARKTKFRLIPDNF